MALLSEPTASALKEYGRGVAGGLLFSLPMLYTMEIWWTGFIANPSRLLIYVLVTFALLLAYNYFVGLKRSFSWQAEIMDAVEEIGLGLLIAALVLYLIGRITPQMPWDEVSGKVIVEGMTVAIGVSVGEVQLGSGGGESKDRGGSGGEQGAPQAKNGADRQGEQKDQGGGQAEGEHQAQKSGQEGKRSKTHAMLGQLVLAICGAILVAANVAPTEEIMLIGIETNAWKLVGLVLFSLVVGGAILYYSDFHGASSIPSPDGAREVASGILMMYGAALVTSGFMLWFFGRFDGMPLYMMAAQTVVLGLPAALGASAGRLLLQG